MATHSKIQKFILKVHSSRLRRAKWDLTVSLKEARLTEEMIALADSQVLRWIDEFNGVTNLDGQFRAIRNEIRRLRREPTNVTNRRNLKAEYEKLDALLYVPDYMCVIMDNTTDYYRACKGFMVNGVKYVRLLGTNGGVKNSTIVFVSQRISRFLKNRIENGRNKDVELVPAKFEAYKALTCSASTPVRFPEGLIVVNDCETSFYDDVIYVEDDPSGRPIMKPDEHAKIDLVESDGYGIMLPSLATKWAEDLGIEYLPTGLNTRFAWEKGMVYTFDFLEFAEKVAGRYTVTDAWGTERDVRNAELILTTSMVKLWDSYESCEDYLQHSLENKYTFGITKVCPEELESQRDLNYQFIQGYKLSHDDIVELVTPTINEIDDVLGGDYRKSIIYLKGIGLNDDNVDYLTNDFVKAIMIAPEMVEDPYVRNKIYEMIKNGINEAKVGVIRVHGNYSMVCGDPYSLCQSIFGMEVTGLLKPTEIYNGYWADRGADKLVCFRAPMSSQSNVRAVTVNRSEEARHWYQYMTTCTCLSSFSNECAALNGADQLRSPVSVMVQ